MTNLRTKISELVQYINTFGKSRYIKRLNVNTMETTNTMLTLDSFDIRLIKLTGNEKILLEKEQDIVYPTIAEEMGNIVDLLKADPTTRQAIVHNIPRVIDEQVFPCISLIHFLSDGERLTMTAFIRSSNIKEFLLVDIVFLNDLLVDVAKRVDQIPDVLTVFISSAHTYQTNDK